MLWWHWIFLGAALLVLDMVLINIYYLLWFGLGALAVGVTLLAFPAMAFAWQIALFGAVSAGFLLLWLLLFRPRGRRKLHAEAKEELIGSRAAVVRFNNGNGTLRLQKPIGGRDVWRFTSSAALAAGESVVISALNDDGIVQASPVAEKR